MIFRYIVCFIICENNGKGFLAVPVNWKILLIDDDEDIRDIMDVTISDAGFRVFCAPDGNIGLELALREKPQIIITDIKMPGMSGLDVLEHIKKTSPETEVIVTTGFADIKNAVKALQLDASDFIAKPVDDAALHTALKRAMQRYTDRKQLYDYTTLLKNENLKTSAELVKSVGFQSSLIENSMDGILGCDETDLIVTYNRSMEKLLGCPKAQVLKKMKVISLFPRDSFLKLKQDLAGSEFGGKNTLVDYETTMLAGDGTCIPVQISGFVMCREKINNSMVLFVRDLREVASLKRQVVHQAQLLHREKMVSLGRLAASMVHEINNPLSGILNYIRLMIRLNKKTHADSNLLPADVRARLDKFNSYLAIIESETQRCSELVSGLLKFSRKTRLVQEKVDISKLVDHSLLLCAHKLELSNIELITDCNPDVPYVTGDFNQLEQCVINLIFNAIDAMENGGILEIKTGYDKNEKLVFISVKDTGKGITKDELNFIFEPFFTTKNQGYGVGLGLSSAYGIIEKHKGTIIVESEPGKGSEFVIKLPAVNEL